MCESLFMELKYVKSDIQKCFPPDFPIFEMYRLCYTKAIATRLKPDMTQLVETEPTIVISLNQFVQKITEAMVEMGFDDTMKLDM